MPSYAQPCQHSAQKSLLHSERLSVDRVARLWRRRPCIGAPPLAIACLKCGDVLRWFCSESYRQLSRRRAAIGRRLAEGATAAINSSWCARDAAAVDAHGASGGKIKRFAIAAEGNQRHRPPHAPRGAVEERHVL